MASNEMMGAIEVNALLRHKFVFRVLYNKYDILELVHEQIPIESAV